jgi:hypothetical protein
MANLSDWTQQGLVIHALTWMKFRRVAPSTHYSSCLLEKTELTLIVLIVRSTSTWVNIYPLPSPLVRLYRPPNPLAHLYPPPILLALPLGSGGSR